MPPESALSPQRLWRKRMIGRVRGTDCNIRGARAGRGRTKNSTLDGGGAIRLGNNYVPIHLARVSAFNVHILHFRRHVAPACVNWTTSSHHANCKNLDVLKTIINTPKISSASRNRTVNFLKEASDPAPDPSVSASQGPTRIPSAQLANLTLLWQQIGHHPF